MGREPLSRRALLRIGGLGVVGLTGCVFGNGGDEPAERRPTDRRTTGGSSKSSPSSTVPSSSSTETGIEQTPKETTRTTDEGAATEGDDRSGPPDLCSANPRIRGRGPLLVARNSRELRKCAGRPLDPFEDLSPWEAVSGSMRETSEGFVGSRSLRIEGTRDTYTTVRRRFPDGIDLSDRDLSVAVDLETPATEQLEVRLFAPDVENSVSCKRVFRAAGWYRLDVGPTDVRGSPDLTEVKELQLRVYSGSGPLRMTVDSLRTTERAARGAVVLTFDDNLRSQYETAFPITQEFGVPGVVGVIPEGVGDSGRLSVDEMHEMQRAGWDVVSHPQERESIPEMGARRAKREIRDTKRWLTENGFERGAQYLIWPYNDYDADSLEIASRYHRLGFAMGGCPVGRRVTGPLSIGRVHGDEVEHSKRMIDLAARYNDLAVIMYHTIGADDDRISEREFRDVMAHVDRADVDVITTTDLWESLGTS